MGPEWEAIFPLRDSVARRKWKKASAVGSTTCRSMAKKSHWLG